MKIRGIHHIGIAVKNLEESIIRWQNLFGGKAGHFEEIPERGVKLAHLAFGEGPALELVSPLGKDSPVAHFLEKRGEGIHHLTLEVEDLESLMVWLKNAGLEFTDEKPRRGAGGSLIAFVHPQTLNGVLLELREEKHES